MPDGHTRRRLLELSGTAAVVGLAGCTSLGAQQDDGGNGADTDQTDQPSDEKEDENHDEGEGENHDEEEDESHDEQEDGHHDEEEDENHDEGEGENHDEGEGENHDEGEGENHDEQEEDGHHDEQEEDEHGHNHDEGMPEAPSQTAKVALETDNQQHHFKPHVVWVEPGGTVTWQLESGSHDTVAYHPDNDRPLRIPEEGEPWSSELLSEEGATFEHTFETEGVYDYYCTPHEGVGMVGTVIVGDPDAHEQPALEDPQSTLPEGARTELADLADNVNEVLGHTH